jgi:hypothetical protein
VTVDAADLKRQAQRLLEQVEQLEQRPPTTIRFSGFEPSGHRQAVLILNVDGVATDVAVSFDQTVQLAGRLVATIASWADAGEYRELADLDVDGEA